MRHSCVLESASLWRGQATRRVRWGSPRATFSALCSEPPRAERDRKRHDHEEGVAEGAQSGRIGTPCCINDGGRGLAYRPSEAYGERIHKWLPFLVEERQGFPPRIKQILTRAAQACLIKPNAR